MWERVPRARSPTDKRVLGQGFLKSEFEHFACDIKHMEEFFKQSGKTGRKGTGHHNNILEKYLSKCISLHICKLVRFISDSTSLDVVLRHPIVISFHQLKDVLYQTFVCHNQSSYHRLYPTSKTSIMFVLWIIKRVAVSTHKSNWWI